MPRTTSSTVRDVEVTTLANGIRVVTEQMPHVRSLSVRRTDEGVTVEADLKADPGCDVSEVLGMIADRDDVLGVDLA